MSKQASADWRLSSEEPATGAGRRRHAARALVALALTAGLCGAAAGLAEAPALASTISERPTTVIFNKPGKGTLTVPANSQISYIYVVGAPGGQGAGGEGSQGGRGGLGSYAKSVNFESGLGHFTTAPIEYEVTVGEAGIPGNEGGAEGGKPGGGYGVEGGGGGGGASMVCVVGYSYLGERECGIITGGGGGGGSEPEGGGPSAGAGGGGEPYFEYSHSGATNEVPALEGLDGITGALGGPHSEPGHGGYIDNGGEGGKGSVESGGPGGDSTPVAGSTQLVSGGHGGKGSSDNGGGGGGGGCTDAGGGGGGGGVETIGEGEEAKVGGGGGGAGGVSCIDPSALGFGGGSNQEGVQGASSAIVEIAYVTKIGTTEGGSGSTSTGSGSSPSAATGSVGTASPAGGETLNVPLSCEAPASESCEMKLTLTAQEQLKNGVVTAVKARELTELRPIGMREPEAVGLAAKAQKAKHGNGKRNGSHKHAKTKRKTVTLAEAIVVLVGTESETVPLHIDATGKSLLRHHPKLRASLKVVGPVAGTGKSISKQAVTLHK